MPNYNAQVPPYSIFPGDVALAFKSEAPAAGQATRQFALPSYAGFPENGRTIRWQTIYGTAPSAVSIVLQTAMTDADAQYTTAAPESSCKSSDSHLRYDDGASWGIGLTRRLAFGVAMIAAALVLAAAQASRAQNSPAPSPTGQAPQSPSQSPSPPPTSPANSPASSTAPIPDANQSPEASRSRHTIRVTFDYDFRITPACSRKVIKGCVQQFVAYDISAGTKLSAMLFPIPLPTNPVGAVHGITATSPMLDFESGKHLISVSAMGPDGRHSRKSLCTTWIVIP